MTVSELNENFNELLKIPDLGQKDEGQMAKGFTIGKGRKLYWYIIPPFAGWMKYKCFTSRYPIDGSSIRYVPHDQEIIIHF